MSGTDLESHPRDIARFALAHASAGDGAALVFVTAVDGGSVRAPGLRMAVRRDGASLGYVSNGCVEADLIAIAQAAIAAGQPTTVSYGRGSGKIDIVLPCGGRIDLTIVPVGAEHITPLAAMLGDERASGTLTLGEGTITWNDAGSAPEQGEIAFAVHPKIRLLIFGIGAEALILGKLAAAADMVVEMISPDADTLERARAFGLIGTELKGLSGPANVTVDAGTALALMFHDHEWEQRILVDALAGPAFYIGALGSRRAHDRRVEALLAAGCARSAIAGIKAPIGLVHQLRDPNLLAASVIAEIAAAFQARFTAF